MRKTAQLLFTALLVISTVSCVNNEYSLFEDPRLPESECFDFKTKTEVTLSINYGFEGYSVPFEVYSTNPLDENDVKIEDKSPIFAAFTDINSSFTGDITLPTHTETIYLYSDALAIPMLLEIDVKNGRAEYQYETTAIETRNISYEGTCFNIGSHKTTINAGNKLYALYNDYVNRSNSFNVIYKPSNSWNSNIYSIVEHSTRLTPNSTLGELINRIQNTLKDATNNSVYCSDSKQTNLRIAHTTEAGEIVDAAHIDLVFIAARGSYHNAMGYYYYPSNQTLTADEIKALPKFMVFPRTTTSKPSKPIKARIQFFGDDYNQDGTDHFPPGYTIGWVLIPNLGEGISFSSSANINTVNNSINSTYNKRAIYSDREANLNQNYGCVTLADKLSERIVIGFEDQAYTTSCGDKSYEDILFYVECDPVAAIFDPERPEISDKPDVTEVLRTQTQVSTLAYEDIWPSGGDYDMNDVVVELTNSITFNQNNLIKRIETNVKAAHCGATLDNAFGIVVNGTVGDVVEEESNIFIKEESNQFIFFSNIMESVGETYTLVRTFGDNGIDKLTYDDTYNPFIVISYTPGMKSRKEVHLPKTQPTSWIDQSLLGQGRDMYFMDIEGKYPFAIELFDVKNWEVATEKSRIGSDGEYPGFNKWVESFGETNTDWYLHKN